MKLNPLASALLALFAAQTTAQQSTETLPGSQTKTLGVVTVTGGQPTSLPTQIPTTMEGVTREQIESTINATDSEDALKYLPSLSIRKRYIGDYNHAVLASRASGTNNSARSAVYADGILLSNYLGNGATYAPRWMMVTPEEIERVDVMYGPFSAAYSGNSVGAVIDYVTRMPTKFEAHAKVSAFTQPFDLYGTHETYSGKQASASLGSRNGHWSWWFHANHTDSEGQPLVMTSRLVSGGVAGSAGTPVTGAVLGKDTLNRDVFILGTTTQYHTLQDNAKIKLAYDFSPTVRASYTLGYWQNDGKGRPQTYLRDAAGNPFYSGSFNINGLQYINASSSSANAQLAASNFQPTNDAQEHLMHGLSIKSNTQGVFDWEVAASLFDYAEDESRKPTGALPNALNGGAGSIVDQRGTGWDALALKGTWRPQGRNGEHIVDFGYQQENYKLRILTSATSDWLAGSAGAMTNDVSGKSQLQSIFGQDTWRFAPKWKTVLGARLEQWRTFDGYTKSSTITTNYANRTETYLSPKAALAYQATQDTVLKASLGHAVRIPTVNELYGSTTTSGVQFINDPNLRTEKSWTTELSAEKDWGNALLRGTLFYETVRDSLYSQFNSTFNTNTVQNIGQIRTKGFELALQGSNVLKKGLDLSGSVTYANSLTVKNEGYVSTPGDTLGKWQPRVPQWRATALADYRFTEHLNIAYGLRYSGKQYSQLNNSDVNGFAYTGTSKFFTTDLRVRYKVNKQWSAAFGIDNLNNYQYWNFHPYPQRTYSAELKFDL